MNAFEAVRLRQVALVARQLAPVAERLRAEFDLDEPYRDPGVAEFGLENVVFAVGDTFLEVVSPVQPETTAGRYLERRGGDAGYMAIFQVPEIEAARRRVNDLGVRVVWSADLGDIAATHLHPRDVPGAIVSLDWASPPSTWRWAGPAWTGTVPDPRPGGGIAGITVDAVDPAGLCACWAGVLGLSATDGHAIVLDDGRQTVRFRTATTRGEGITEVAIAGHGEGSVDIGGMRFVRLRSPHG